ncbi:MULTISPECIES: outer membrane protein [Phyllobacteriaceae]|uniref:Outer membrane protein beta-barrel domain-containing protein n=1 Tax=Mesorhizobium hungaricum TaxID=1566387 RepID=A0A1C2DCP2_9HYPH|nr:MULTISPECIES: outer membrane protein [Mesorhizobium]MBN9236847.1 porin family protein [Mesorhizobium sp.]MDQ0331045.1 outer membrane immunogenic protein [Mesorhizobium sp. YL-MeA3-2017]OCX12435.1 hypothetical protein QV13_22685 [Mesorhizobium hungaricum]
MKRYFIAFALLATPISGAFAADAVVDLPVASTFDWNGAYLGGQAGYGWGRADNSFPSNPAAEISGSVDGGFGGLYGGWNIQNGNFVGGIDADINYSGIKGTSTNAATGESLNTKVTWTGDIRGRVGYAMDNLLIYGAGGLALGGIKVNVSNAGGTFASASETRAGWTLGAGAEYAFSNNWVGRAEYKYTDFGKVGYSAPAGDGSVEVNTNTLAIGFAYKF